MTTNPSFQDLADRLGTQLGVELQLNTLVPGSKSTQREHLQQNIPDHEMLTPYIMTDWEEYFMSVFWQLHRDRPWNSMDGSPRRISLQSFVNYQQLFDDTLNTDEIKVLEAIDDAYLKTYRELNED